MRNVFRTLKLPVIISSTDGIAREMITASDGCSPGQNDVRWCVVVPEMPRFQDPAVETLPRDDLARLVRHSRPLFARFAMEYINDHELPSALKESTLRRLVDFTLDYPRHEPSQSSDSEARVRLEAMTTAAMVSASHCNGFAGIPLQAFLVEMVFELGMGHPVPSGDGEEGEEDWRHAIPATLRSRHVPFLASPDTKWPEGLPSALKLGTITRADDTDGKANWRVDDGWLAATILCTDADGEPELTQDGIKKIMDRVQPSCAVHVVVTNQQVGSANFEDESFEDYVRVKCPHLVNTGFLRCGIDGRVRLISGMERPVVSADRVVFILSQTPPPVEEKCDRFAFFVG